MNDFLTLADMPAIVKAVIAVITQQFGVANLGELAVKIQTLNDRVTELEAKHAGLPTRLAEDPVFLQRLGVAQREHREGIAGEIKDNILEILLAIFPPADPKDKDAQRVTLGPLAERIYGERITQGLRIQERGPRIQNWLEDQTASLAETIHGLLLKKVKVDVSGLARWALLAGLEPSNHAGIRDLLSQREEVRDLLRKR